MSIDLAKICVRVPMNLTENCTRHVESRKVATDGSHWHLKIQDSFQQCAIQQNEQSLQDEYVRSTHQEGHSVEVFKDLIQNFSLRKMGKIKLVLRMGYPQFLVEDGVHRLSILKRKNLRLSLNSCCIEIDERVRGLWKNLLSIAANCFGESRAAENLVVSEPRLELQRYNNLDVCGYYSFAIHNFHHHLAGQRNPFQLLERIRAHVVLRGKYVLDLGCNTGAVLFSLPELAGGIGLDANPHSVFAANMIRKYLHQVDHLKFVHTDWNDLDLGQQLETSSFTPDLTFLLLSASIPNWRQLQEDVWEQSRAVILEVHCNEEGTAKVSFFLQKGASVKLIDMIHDSKDNKNALSNLFLIEKPQQQILPIEDTIQIA